MSKEEFLQLADMVYEMGSNQQYHIDLDYRGQWKEAEIYIFEETGDDVVIKDSLVVSMLTETVIDWIEQWSEIIHSAD